MTGQQMMNSKGFAKVTAKRADSTDDTVKLG